MLDLLEKSFNRDAPVSSCYVKNEKHGIAYDWVIVNDRKDDFHENKLQELIVQYYFQCVLGNKQHLLELNVIYDTLIISVARCKDKTKTIYFDYIVKLCLQNRDIKSGKGLCTTTYMMLTAMVYYSFEKELFPRETIIMILNSFVHNIASMNRPYGSWKDLKYFLDYFKFDSRYEFEIVSKEFIITDIIQKIYVPQMIIDRKKISVNESISLCGKWLPRESSNQFGWLAKQIARSYYDEVFQMSTNNIQKYKKYRELVSGFNKYLDTTQIHMDNKEWDEIVFDNVTARTLLKYKKSFSNQKNVTGFHREQCKRNFKKFLHKKRVEGMPLKNNNEVMPHNLVKSVMKGISNDEDAQVINMQWESMIAKMKKKNSDFMKYTFPCIDVSPSMRNFDCTPLHCAIGLGLACAELSNQHRAFTFSSVPEWIKYNPEESFIDRVYKTNSSEWGSTTNIYNLFMKILNLSVSKSYSDDEMKKHCLIIFSDMQFDCQNEFPDEEPLFDIIKRNYSEKGYTNTPFLIFWNLRKTDTFPSIESSQNMLKMSGSSISLLEIFMNFTLDELKRLNNWDLIKHILNNERYCIFK